MLAFYFFILIFRYVVYLFANKPFGSPARRCGATALIVIEIVVVYVIGFVKVQVNIVTIYAKEVISQ